MLKLFNIFKKAEQPKKTLEQRIDYVRLNGAMGRDDGAIALSEPWTFAQARLDGGAKDVGSDRAKRVYNAHKVRLSNQWINPLQSINSGYGNVHKTMFLYQAVNYYECYTMAQDPLFAKVFNLLSQTPFSKGGDITIPDDIALDMDKLNAAVKKYTVWKNVVSAVRSQYVVGGCLLYMDFGLSENELRRPLDLSKMDMRQFRGFRHIDPINVVALDVDTVNPASADYMEPKQWYVIGLGTVDRSHFLKFEANVPELPMRPMCLYFGMPLTQLIKQDVANSNLASQGLANLMNRFRNVYMKTDMSAFVGNNAEQLRQKLEFMSLAQDNFSVCPIKIEESVEQLVASMAGMDANVELFYLLVAAKTDIPYTELMGKSAQGMDATGAGDRRKWYDKCRSIQTDVKDHILTMYGIVAGVISADGKFVKFPDFVFNPLEESSEKERAENIRSYAEVARSLIELGAKQEEVFDWLKSFKEFHLDKITLDDLRDTMEDYGDNVADITDDVMRKFQNEFKESEHPRDEDGKFTDGDGNVKKIGSFEIGRETKKALLLKKDGKTFWIQKRWIRDDGTLTPAGQKSFEEAETDDEKQRAKEEERKKWEEGVSIPKPDWESEKAYGFDIDLDFHNLERSRRHRIFIPKSVIQPNGNIPSWILKKKLEEIEDYYFNKGSWSISRHPFTEWNFGFKDWSGINNSAFEPTEIYRVENGFLEKSDDNGASFARIDNDGE